MKKQQMIEALRRFINQRSGIEFRNYDCGDWKRTRESFMGDYRPILRHGRHARAMLAAVEACDGISEQSLIEASRAYSGRLQFVDRDGGVSVDYTTGQYFPTEYRAAACAVLASALWSHYRDSLTNPDGKVTRSHGSGTFRSESEYDGYNGFTAGEVIRAKAYKAFGRAIARTWFN